MPIVSIVTTTVQATAYEVAKIISVLRLDHTSDHFDNLLDRSDINLNRIVTKAARLRSKPISAGVPPNTLDEANNDLKVIRADLAHLQHCYCTQSVIARLTPSGESLTELQNIAEQLSSLESRLDLILHVSTSTSLLGTEYSNDANDMPPTPRGDACFLPRVKLFNKDLRRLSRFGHGWALADELACLADRFFFGNGVRENESEGFRYFNLAAELGSISAHGDLGYHFEYGIATPKNPEKAAHHYKVSALGGDLLGMVNYGLCRRSGRGVELSVQDSIHYFTMASDAGSLSATTQLGFTYLLYDDSGNNDEKAFELFNRAAHAGIANAQVGLANCYGLGKGVEKDARRAAELFSWANEGNSLAGLVNLAVCYSLGHGVQRNKDEANNLVRLARFITTTDSAHNETDHCRTWDTAFAGFMYEKGIGFERNYEKAAQLYRNAADYGSEIGETQLARLLARGLGVKRNLGEAARRFRVSADKGCSYAQLVLAQFYENGLGVVKDISKAVHFFRLAAEQGDEKAQLKTGFYHEAALGVNRDLNRAKHYLEYQAGQDSSDAADDGVCVH